MTDFESMTTPLSKEVLRLRVGPVDEPGEVRLVTPESLHGFFATIEPGTVWSPVDARSKELLRAWAVENPDSPWSEAIEEKYGTNE